VTGSHPSDSLQAPDLGAEQERATVLEAQAGSRVALGKLAAANFRHVKAIAVRFGSKTPSVDLADLTSEGMVGFLRAVPKFDVNVGTRLITYAAYWIRAYVMLFILNNRSLVRGGGGMVRSKNFFKMRREASKLLGSGACYGDVIDALQVKFKISSRLMVESELVRVFAQDSSLDEQRDDGTSMLDALVSDSDPERHVAQHERAQEVWDALNVLDSRERLIVKRTFLQSEDTLASVARDIGVSRERVRQLQVRALDKIRSLLDARLASD